MYCDAVKGDISSVYLYTNGQTVYQLNGLKSLMNYNDRDDMETNANLQNGVVSSGIGLIISHTIYQHN